ncbi:sterol desaturase family protein [uncultured Ramlibacter sp.]|uniref:sterol desaturase family protein n=1 Tax=uncultured Ramlibacter sp. TaxID=260755 RepID=UPI00260496B7|nr:sterol desaturase family protein [uncultured Ramlibacter sp.]
MDWLDNTFSGAQQWLFETAVQPLMFALGLGQLLEDGYTATGWLLVGLLQIAVLLAVIGPLQRWRPVEAVTDRATIRTDVLYTLIHRLGLFRVALFFLVEPLFDALFGMARVEGLGTFHLDQLWPGVTDVAWASFLIYLLLFDLADYWIHRGQHGLNLWWSLHSLHHSQRQMTMWSDNRNHLLDDLIRDSLLVLLAQLLGVAPGQFVAIVAITQLSESLQHANLRLGFGRVGERLWISPRFHRLHHSIGIGHETHGKGTLGGHNFGVLLPWWDILFGTANFEQRYDPTGVRDQVEQGRDYGRGFWSQQWLGVKRLFGKA